MFGRLSRLEWLGASVGSLDRPGQPASVATNGFRARSPENEPRWVGGCFGVPRILFWIDGPNDLRLWVHECGGRP